MTHRAVSLLLPLVLMACEDSEPCDRYVDYMCDCHLDAASCGELRNVYGDADQDLQDECHISLEEERDQDEAEGVECEADDEG